MTDNEIKKALECCMESDCHNCPYDYFTCDQHQFSDLLDLINRQQAEIERLKLKNGLMNSERKFRKISAEILIARTKAKAYKEFAEKLKENAYLVNGVTGFRDMVVDVDDIDNLLKELVGADV